jgi:hypothetical protein
MREKYAVFAKQNVKQKYSDVVTLGGIYTLTSYKDSWHIRSGVVIFLKIIWRLRKMFRCFWSNTDDYDFGIIKVIGLQLRQQMFCQVMNRFWKYLLRFLCAKCTKWTHTKQIMSICLPTCFNSRMVGQILIQFHGNGMPLG